MITEAKQVGDLIYMVSNAVTLNAILNQQRILASSRKEKNPYTNKQSGNYVCFTRTFDSVSRGNNDRWRYGIKLDGNKLSNKYKIRPYSFVGSNPRSLRLNILTSYDNGTYAIYIVNWGSAEISKEAYEEVKSLIFSQTDEYNKAHKLMRKTGSRKYMGRMVEEQFVYNTKNGGPILNLSELPNLNMCLLNRTDEMEERIWLPEGTDTVDISGCIKSVILPRDISEEEISEINLSGLDVTYY